MAKTSDKLVVNLNPYSRHGIGEPDVHEVASMTISVGEFAVTLQPEDGYIKVMETGFSCPGLLIRPVADNTVVLMPRRPIPKATE